MKVFMLVLFSSLFGYFLIYNYKEYGETIINDDSLLTLAGGLGAIANGVGRILYCFAFDDFSIRAVFTVMNASLLLCCVASYLVTNGYLYIVVVVLSYLSFGAIYGIMATQTTRFLG